MTKAICLRCGTRKSAPWKKCRQCGYAPNLDPDVDGIVKSVYLSMGRYDDPIAREDYQIELDRIAQAIQHGEQPVFLESDLVRLRQQRLLFKHVPNSAVWSAMLRLFLPATGFVALLIGIAWLVKVLKH